MIEAFADGLWLADGPVVQGAGGFRYPTRMALVRLPDGGLFVWSPVALDDTLRAEVDALGPVTHIVAPNSLHHVFVAEWSAAWPEARVHAAPGLAKVRPDLAFHATLDDTPDPAWAGTLDQVVMYGNAITTETVFFHRPSGAVIVTDLIQHLPDDWFSGWRRLIATWDRMTGPEPAVPRKFRLAFTGRKAARAARDRLLAWPAERLVMAHGAPVTEDAAGLLRRAFSWL